MVRRVFAHAIPPSPLHSLAAYPSSTAATEVEFQIWISVAGLVFVPELPPLAPEGSSYPLWHCPCLASSAADPFLPRTGGTDITSMEFVELSRGPCGLTSHKFGSRQHVEEEVRHVSRALHQILVAAAGQKPHLEFTSLINDSHKV